MVNVDAALVTEPEALRDALVRQVTGAVRWTESMQLLIAEGVTNFVEVGPGKVLSGLLRQIDRSQKCAQAEDPASIEKLLAALASLSKAGPGRSQSSSFCARTQRKTGVFCPLTSTPTTTPEPTVLDITILCVLMSPQSLECPQSTSKRP